jgi:dTDP-4-amino-4,6-dideoxygalactose transaminase
VFDTRNADVDAIPLSVPVLAGNEWAYVKECLDTGFLAAGPMLGRFEAALRDLTGAGHVIACASGTAALHTALLVAGVQPGDAVLVPTITFAATVNAVVYAGAHPVFIGCDDFLDIDAEAVEVFLAEECDEDSDGPRLRATGQRVAAIVPVHVFGAPCDMVSILDTAKRHRVAVVEDAAESVGSRWTDGDLAGRHTGAVADMGVLSFNGNKIVTCGGGGAVLTNSEDAAARVRYLIDQAKDDRVRYIHGEVGFNYRMTATAAAIGLAQLERLDVVIETKRRNLVQYVERLSGLPGLSLLGAPQGTASNHWFYSLLVEPEQAGIDREQLMADLAAHNIQTRPLWYPNHLQRAYDGAVTYRVDRAIWFWQRVLNLPCSADLTLAHVDRICDAIESALPNSA